VLEKQRRLLEVSVCVTDKPVGEEPQAEIPAETERPVWVQKGNPESQEDRKDSK
jgi:hypothetical protein